MKMLPLYKNVTMSVLLECMLITSIRKIQHALVLFLCYLYTLLLKLYYQCLSISIDEDKWLVHISAYNEIQQMTDEVNYRTI